MITTNHYSEVTRYPTLRAATVLTEITAFAKIIPSKPDLGVSDKGSLLNSI